MRGCGAQHGGVARRRRDEHDDLHETDGNPGQPKAGFPFEREGGSGSNPKDVGVESRMVVPRGGWVRVRSGLSGSGPG
eukprot:scaffold798_cov367-Pavlova_lutheri.AAC.15